MAFLVYLFVLLVAAGSIVFGLDLTQSPLQPPSYATANATSDSSSSTVLARTAPAASVSTPASVKTKTMSEPAGIAAARAQATPDEAQSQTPATTASVAAPNHCAIEACAAAYHSFRATDCTYQPFGGERRLCTKGTAAKPVAAARPAVAHRASRASDLRRVYDRRYAERDDYRDSYDEPRRGGGFSLFGDAFGR